ncbi:ABC transporter substrate-binding protein [Paenibacillus thermotolerans]|uniref:ABC transporter substrate-binding protein n=1 Tax=Paenibacillus thermotolerans TaxID=3027807 RepID=UPI002367BCE5|nr:MULTISPECIES: extracellular solute-binding protein [unclassified Paenibacillus]
MKKTLIVSIVTLSCMLILLLGLGSTSPVKVNAPGGPNGLSDQEASVTPPQQPIQLHISLSAPSKTLSLLKEATDAFMRWNPRIEVALDNVPEQQAFDKYAKLSALGLAPDVMLLDAAWVYGYASDGRLRALDDLIPVERQNRWFDSVRQSAKWNGYIWAVPLYWDPYVILYNPEAISAEQGGTGFPADLYGWFEQHGNPALDGSDESAYRLVMDELKESVEAANQQGEPPASESGAAAVNGMADALSQEQETFAAGARQAIESLIVGKVEWSVLRLSEAMKYESASEPGGPRLSLTQLPFAAGKERMAPPHYGQSFAVSAASQHPEEAASWITFILDYFSSETAYGYDGYSTLKTAYDIPTVTTPPSSAAIDEHGFPLNGINSANLGWLLRSFGTVPSNAEAASAEKPMVPLRLSEESLLETQ